MTCEPKWTPGPWEPMLDGPDRGREPWEPWEAYMEAAPGLTIASVHNTEPVARVSGYCQPVIANARLIAAAPALYEALRDLMENPLFQVAIGGNPDMVDDLMDRARAALSLALGKQQ